MQFDGHYFETILFFFLFNSNPGKPPQFISQFLVGGQTVPLGLFRCVEDDHIHSPGHLPMLTLIRLFTTPIGYERRIESCAP